MTEDIELIAAALRADSADLEVYARVLTTSLADALPEGMVEVERDRSFADRVAGRPGRVRGISVAIGEWELTLSSPSGHGHGPPLAHARQRVRGVVISSRDVPIEEWVRLLAGGLADRARHSAEARVALGRLLGQSS